IYRLRLPAGESSGLLEPNLTVAPNASPALHERLALTRGPLVFDYHQSSYAGERIESITAAYAAALERLGTFLGRDLAALPPIRLRLLDLPPDDSADAEQTGQAGL